MVRHHTRSRGDRAATSPAPGEIPPSDLKCAWVPADPWGMDSTTSSRQAAARAALEPYAWRGLTPQMLARQVLGAADRRGPARPAARDDPRVEPLVEFLVTQSWRALTLGELSRRLVEALEAWETRDLWWDLELAMLLDGGG